MGKQAAVSHSSELTRLRSTNHPKQPLQTHRISKSTHLPKTLKLPFLPALHFRHAATLRIDHKAGCIFFTLRPCTLTTTHASIFFTRRPYKLSATLPTHFRSS